MFKHISEAETDIYQRGQFSWLLQAQNWFTSKDWLCWWPPDKKGMSLLSDGAMKTFSEKIGESMDCPYHFLGKKKLNLTS